MHGPPRPTPGLHGTGSLPVRGTRAPKLDLDRRRDMPELPEVETTVRGLARYLEGERIARIAVNRDCDFNGGALIGFDSEMSIAQF